MKTKSLLIFLIILIFQFNISFAAYQQSHDDSVTINSVKFDVSSSSSDGTSGYLYGNPTETNSEGHSKPNPVESNNVSQMVNHYINANNPAGGTISGFLIPNNSTNAVATAQFNKSYANGNNALSISFNANGSIKSVTLNGSPITVQGFANLLASGLSDFAVNSFRLDNGTAGSTNNFASTAVFSTAFTIASYLAKPPPGEEGKVYGYTWNSTVDTQENTNSKARARVFNSAYEVNAADGSINKEVYDVKQAIPTSERLIQEISAPRALYYIEAQQWGAASGYIGCRASALGKATYKYKVYYDCNCGYYGTGRFRMYLCDTCSDERTDEVYAFFQKINTHGKSDSGVGVAKSDIRPVQYGKIMSVYENDAGTILPYESITLEGTDRPGPQPLSASAKAPSVRDGVLGVADGGEHSSQSAAQQAAKDAAEAWVYGEFGRWNASEVASVGGSCNYHYEGYTVTRGGVSGKVNVGYTLGRVGILQDESNYLKNNLDRLKNFSTEKLNKRLENLSSISNQTFYPTGNIILIPNYMPNGTYKSIAKVYYGYSPTSITKQIVSTKSSEFDLPPNDVIVHAPVINYSKIVNKKSFVNQKINRDSNLEYLQLDSEFSIEFPNKGPHREYQNYGDREYLTKQGYYHRDHTWAYVKDVKFPFDVYVHNKNGNGEKYFLPANVWLSDAFLIYTKQKTVDELDDVYIDIDYEGINPDNIDYYSLIHRFTIPVWVKEGVYSGNSSGSVDENAVGGAIITRTIAENGYDWDLAQDFANLSIDKYVALKAIPCEIIGKIYDLRVNATNDPGWGDVYSYSHNKDYIDSAELAFGQKGQNRNSAYAYAPKLGYTFVYNFKTKGRKSNNVDTIIAQNGGFFFVPKNGAQDTKPVNVVLFYTKSGTSTYLPVFGNSQIQVNLNANYMEIPQEEKTNSNLIYPMEYGAKDPQGVALPYNYNTPVMLRNNIISNNNSSFNNRYEINLPHNLRFTYDNFAEYLSANNPNNLQYLKKVNLRYTANVNGVNVTKTDENGNVYQYKGITVQGLYGRNNSKSSIIDDLKRHSEAMVKDGYNKGNNADSETGEQYIIGSVGHWYAGFRLPTSTVAISKDAITKELGFKTITNENANDIVLKAKQQNKILTDGYLGITFKLVSNSNEWEYLMYRGPEVKNVYTNEDYGIIYYETKDYDTPASPGTEQLYYTFESNQTTFSIKYVPPTNTEITLPNGSKITKDPGYSIGTLKQTVTLPNGRKQDVPAGMVAFFEAGLKASADVNVGQDY